MIANAKDTKDMSALYLELFEIMDRYPESIDGLLFEQGRRPAGFTIWDKARTDMANVLVNLGDTSIAGLSDFQLVTTCRYLHDAGVRHANMGGSELETLDAFKAKFQPVKTAKILSAEVTYRKPENANIEVYEMVAP